MAKPNDFKQHTYTPNAFYDYLNIMNKALAGDMVFVCTPSAPTKVATAAAWTRTVTITLETAAGELHGWFNKAISAGVSIGDTSSAGTASIPSTTLTFVEGTASVVVSGDAAAWLGGVKQVETIQITHAADAAGTLVWRVTAAAVTGSPVDVNVDVELGDAVGEVAQKIVDAINANAAIAAQYVASLVTDSVRLTRAGTYGKANDATLAMALQDADSTGVTVGSSTNTTAGVAAETDTLTVAQATILGYTVAAATSVETITLT